MKKIILICTVFLTGQLLNSCKEDSLASESIQIAEAVLVNDLHFQKIQSLIDFQTQKALENFNNLDAVERKELLAKYKAFSESNVTPENIDEISKLIGFIDVNEMNKFATEIQNTMNLLLENNPSLNNLNQEQKITCLQILSIKL